MKEACCARELKTCRIDVVMMVIIIMMDHLSFRAHIHEGFNDDLGWLLKAGRWLFNKSSIINNSHPLL